MPKLEGVITATIALGGTKSAAFDMKGACDTLKILLPTMTDCTISLEEATELAGTYTRLGPTSYSRYVGTGGYWIEVNANKGRFFKIVSSVAQAAEESFSVRRGIDGFQ